MARKGPKAPTQAPEGGSPARNDWRFWLCGAWALLILVLQWRLYNRAMPIGILQLCELLPVRLAIGPHFGAFWVGHAIRAAGGLGFFLGAWAVGDAIRARLAAGARHALPPSWNLALSLGIGLGILAFISFAAFGLGAGRRSVFWCLYAVLVCLGIRGSLSARKHAASGIAAAPGLAEKLIGLILCVELLLAFLGTTMPEIFFDALAYHLAVPQAYVFAGRMVELPHNLNSYLPLLASSLFSWGLVLDGMYSAKLIGFGLGACLILAVYAAGSALGGRRLGLLSCALLLGSPMVLYLFWMTNCDVCTAFFLLLSAMAAWQWAETAMADPGLLFLSGLFAGFSLASKYTAAFGVALVSLLVLWKKRRILEPGSLRTLAIYFALILLPLVPWWARNYTYNGNPFYPYFAWELGPKGADLALLNDWHKETKDASPGANPVRHAMKLWTDSLDPWPSYGETLGPVFLAFSPLLLMPLETGAAQALAVFSVAAMLMGLSFTYVTRLLLPYLVPLAPALAVAMSEAFRNAAHRRLLLAALVATLGSNLFLFVNKMIMAGYDGMTVATGQKTPAEFLRAEHNGYKNPSYSAYEKVGALGLKPEERVLIVGETRSFYSPVLPIANGTHDVPLIYRWADQAKTPEALFAKLKLEGISVIVVNSHGSHPDSARYTKPEALAVIAPMAQRYFDVVYSDAWTTVWRRK